MWGTGASSTQCEGASPASDWLQWERSGHAPPSGDGSGFATRYAEDFALLAGLGLTHHRLSIDWARIEPEPGRRDPAADRPLPRRAGRRPRRRRRAVGVPAPLHAAAVVRRRRRLRGRGQPGGPVDRPRRVRRRDVRRSRRWLAADQRGQHLRPAGVPRRDRPTGPWDAGDAAAAEESIHLANAEAAVRLRQTGRRCRRSSPSRRSSRGTTMRRRCNGRRASTSGCGRRASACSGTGCCGSATGRRSSGPTSPGRSI